MKIVKSDSNVQEMLLLFVIVVGAIFLIVTMVNYGNNKQNTMDTMVSPPPPPPPSQPSQKNPVLENSGSVEASTPDVMCGVSPAPVSGVQSPGANFTPQKPEELLPKQSDNSSMMNPPLITSQMKPNMLAASDVIGTSSSYLGASPNLTIRSDPPIPPAGSVGPWSNSSNVERDSRPGLDQCNKGAPM
tara:strand:- start:42 stop:605 length:564 start_codon:yes stop_codon:yes gene_type:complete